MAAGLFALLLAVSPAAGQGWRVEAAYGSAYNFRLPLTIEQRGEPPIEVDARFTTRATGIPLYWVVRLEKLRNGTAWGVELLHHKLYMEDRPPEIERFEITHGFNILSVVRSAGGDRIGHRLGLGAIVAHPGSTIREKTSGDGSGSGGYHFTGPAAQAALVGRQPVAGGFGVLLELKAVAARVRVPVADGHARLWHGSLHLNVGLSQTF